MFGYMATVAKLLVKSKEMGLSLQESEAVGVKTALRRAIYLAADSTLLVVLCLNDQELTW